MKATYVLYSPNHLVRTKTLSSTARILLDVFALHMREEDNLIYFIEGGMVFYIGYCEFHLNRKYSEKTIRNAVSEIVKCGVMKRVKSNIYTIDKNFCIKVDVTKRLAEKQKGSMNNSAEVD
jgi:hypothetical protein